MALFLGRFRPNSSSAFPSNQAMPEKLPSMEAILAAIGVKIARGGGAALSATESKIWNTAVVISYLSSDPTDHVPGNARVLSWTAAQAGFEDMGLPAAASFVTSLVTELAFRTEFDPCDQHSETASLLRLANLKQQFSSLEEDNDLWELLRRLIERAAG